MYDALTIAEYIIYYSHEKEYRINNVRIQRILFLLQSYYINIKRTKLFYDPITAEIIGPTIKKVYDKYKRYGNRNIPLKNIEDSFNQTIYKKDIETINCMIDLLSDYSNPILTHLCYGKEWRVARNRWMKTDRKENKIITINDMDNRK